MTKTGATPVVAAYGSWPSQVPASLGSRSTVRIGEIEVDGEDAYWTEERPDEEGRVALVRRRADGRTDDVIPLGMSVRTRVHEYGGGSFTVDRGTVWFVNEADQRLHRLSPSGEVQPVTAPAAPRYADLVLDRGRGRMLCVREQVVAGTTENVVAAIDLGTGQSETLVQGADFYSSPRLSADGRRLCWVEWDHPQMPWDGTRLRVATLDDEGRSAESRQLVAGGPDESVVQPLWSPRGDLFFVSDRSGWWNVYW